MKLGVILEQGGGLESMRRTGQEDRLLFYLRAYREVFDEVVFFSYQDEEGGNLSEGIRLLPRRSRLPALLYSFQLPWVFREEMGSLDLLRVLQMSGSTPAAISRRSHGVPYAVTYGYDAMGLARSGGGKRAALARWSLFLATRSAEVIFCATESLVGQMERRRPRGRVVLLPNGVDLRRFRARPVRASAQGRWKVFSVGRLAAEKNYAMLVAAAAGLGDVELHLVGDGPEAASLDRAAERARVPLMRHGVVPQEKLALLLSEADLFVLPSRSEGHPKALIEAMACALPCIGTNVPGLRDVLENGVNGLLVAETALELKETIRRLLMDRELALRLGEAARRTVERNFDLDRILKSEVAILEGLALDARRRGRGPVTVT